MPAMRPNCRSSGEATAEAIVSGLAPGRLAETWMTGNSTCGSGATGRNLKANMPDSSNAAVSSDVPTGRLINGADMFIQVADFEIVEASLTGSHVRYSAILIDSKKLWGGISRRKAGATNSNLSGYDTIGKGRGLGHSGVVMLRRMRNPNPNQRPRNSVISTVEPASETESRASRARSGRGTRSRSATTTTP